MKPTIKFVIGSLYPLNAIRRETAFFKTKADIPTDVGLFHLYAHRAEGTCWIGGPFAGRDSNLFMFLGVPSSQVDLRATIMKLRASKRPTGKTDHDLYGEGSNRGSFSDVIGGLFSGSGNDDFGGSAFDGDVFGGVSLFDFLDAFDFHDWGHWGG